MRLFVFLFLVAITLLCSCKTSNQVFGRYVSNFPVSGYFSTEIRLRSDSMMEYRYSGHLQFDTAVAKYRIIDDTIYLQYEPFKQDTIDWAYFRKQGILLNENLLPKYGASAPGSLLIERGKLLLLDRNNVVVRKRQNRAGKMRRFFLARI